MDALFSGVLCHLSPICSKVQGLTLSTHLGPALGAFENAVPATATPHTSSISNFSTAISMTRMCRMSSGHWE